MYLVHQTIRVSKESPYSLPRKFENVGRRGLLLWGYLKSKVFNPANIEELKERIKYEGRLILLEIFLNAHEDALFVTNFFLSYFVNVNE